MAQLAIKGHKTRGREVIELLRSLGGMNILNCAGLNENSLYYIGKSGIICYGTMSHNRKVLTLEQFLEEFPYKVGDKVLITDDTNDVYIIKSMTWNKRTEGVAYRIETINGIEDNCDWYSDEMVYYKKQKEETMEENLTIQDIRDNNAEWLLNKLEEMSAEDALQTISDLYDELHKPQYPKTYGECHELMVQWKEYDCNPNSELILCDAPIHDFCKLIVARNIYWKIAGEEMGLGKPWKPDWESESTPKYTISQAKNKIRFLKSYEYNHILSFPTTEMREAFYENFKELIEQCKELL